jgi:hypothetical protein
METRQEQMFMVRNEMMGGKYIFRKVIPMLLEEKGWGEV